MEIRLHRHKEEWGISYRQIENIILETCRIIDLSASSIDIIFTDDSTISSLHGTYLNDSSPTDVITFDLGDDEIEGEIYISVERAKLQAEEYRVTLKEELTRLIVHGLLHLKGYDDREETDRRIMKEKEDALVKLFGKEGQS